MPMRLREIQKAATRQSLLAAAEACFTESGFDTSIATIARRAGVATGTFYVHFAGKDAVLDELLLAFNTTLIERLAPVASSSASPRTLVRAMARVCLDTWSEGRGLLECFLRRAAKGGALLAARDGINPQVAGLVTGTLQALAASRGVHLKRPELVTHGLLGLWTRVGLQYVFTESVSRKEAVDVLTRMSLGTLQGLGLLTSED